LNRESCIALVRNQVLYRVFATIYYVCRLFVVDLSML